MILDVWVLHDVGVVLFHLTAGIAIFGLSSRTLSVRDAGRVDDVSAETAMGIPKAVHVAGGALRPIGRFGLGNYGRAASGAPAISLSKLLEVVGDLAGG